MSEKRQRTPWQPPAHLQPNSSTSATTAQNNNRDNNTPVHDDSDDIDDHDTPHDLPPAYSPPTTSISLSHGSTPSSSSTRTHTSSRPNPSISRDWPSSSTASVTSVNSVASAASGSTITGSPAPPNASHSTSYHNPPIPGLPAINYAAYTPANGTTSSDLGVTTVVDGGLARSPPLLARFLAEQTAVPPVPEVRIRGVAAGGSGRVDFDVRMNMLKYFLPREGERGLNYSSYSTTAKHKGAALSNVGGNVDAWARDFCKERSPHKTFIITRRLTNWDTEFLSGKLHGLVQSLNYRGQVEVKFISNHHQIILKPEQSLTSSLRAMFISAEKFEVDVIWPYATHVADEDSDEHHNSSRKCLVRSEQGWFKDWRSTIRHAILSRKKGWISDSDWMEMMMSPHGPELIPGAW